MWRYRYSDELYHGDHKYIAKIGQGVKAKYFYTQEALDAYKKALSSSDEKVALDKAVKDQNAKAKDLESVDKADAKNVAKAIKNKDREAVKKELSEIVTKGKQQQMNEAAAKTKAAEKAYAESQTVKGKAKAVADTYKKLNPKSAERIQNGKKYLDELLKKRR